jgi:hypothetical protein
MQLIKVYTKGKSLYHLYHIQTCVISVSSRGHHCQSYHNIKYAALLPMAQFQSYLEFLKM